MILLKRSTLRAVLLGLSLSGCSLLQDPDSLTSGNPGDVSQAAGAAGSTGSSSSGAGGADAGSSSSSGATCQPASIDSSCDGLDQACQPTAQESICPTGCTGIAFEGASYTGCTVGADFNTAEILCQRQGMHLVEIDSATENDFVTQIAQTLGSYVWIGGSDLTLSGTFSWLEGPAFFADGAAVPGAYQNFASGQPVKAAGLDCVQLHDDPAGPWSNARCADNKQFICERR
jgi:hypothetical protein